MYKCLNKMNCYPDEKLCKSVSEQKALAHRSQIDNANTVGILELDETTIENSSRNSNFIDLKFVAVVGLFVLATVLLVGYFKAFKYT